MINDGNGNITVPSIKINGTSLGAPTTGGGDLFFTTPTTNSIPNNIAIAQGSVFIKNGGLSIEGGGINVATAGKSVTFSGTGKISYESPAQGSIISNIKLGGTNVNVVIENTLGIANIYPNGTTDRNTLTIDGNVNIKTCTVTGNGTFDNIKIKGTTIDEDNSDEDNSNLNIVAAYVSGNSGRSKGIVFTCNALGLNGDVYSYTNNLSSDYRLKSNVRDIDEITTLNLRPVQFDMHDKHRIGLIAHELQEQIPCVVEGVKDGEKMQYVNYVDLIAVLIKDIQRLNQRIMVLESLGTR